MAASDHLSPYQFSMRGPVVTAEHPEHGAVGEMSLDPDSGEVMSIEVEPKFRRQGIATGMWEHAKQHSSIEPRHSGVRTRSGNAWAKAVGGELPKRQRVDNQGFTVEYGGRLP